MNVIKRDGTIQKFDFNKIKFVIQKAFDSVCNTPPKFLINELEEYFNNLQIDEIDVESIQDIIQNKLIEGNYFDVVESFIVYRTKHAEIREQKSQLIKDIQSKLKGNNIENQNANLDEESFGGRINEAARIVVKNDALKYRMSKKSRKNHEDNYIYIHDLDSYSVGEHNCLSMPIDNLLKNGFSTRQTDVRPAGGVNTALQLVAVLFQLQSLQQFGGVAATHIDWTMVPYIRKTFYKHFMEGLKYIEDIMLPKQDHPEEISIEDKYYMTFPRVFKYAYDMTANDIKQGAEGIFHNLNTLQSRSGNQLPFSSINFGTCTLPEGRIMTRALLTTLIDGLGVHGVTSIFPCCIFQYKKGINDKPGTPNYDLYRLALQATSKRLYPNYANCDWSNQQSWVKSDRELKENIINSLDDEEYNKLINILETNPKLAEFLDLEIVEE